MKAWLEKLEDEYKIEILFACEGGSLAWGTDTDESDRDIRFIFKHHDIRSYLSLSSPVEVIDYSNPFDAHGWDVFKAFRLLEKSNPSLYEWAFSPVVYVDEGHFSTRLQESIIENYSPYSLAMHYVHLMDRNLKNVLDKAVFDKKALKRLIQVMKAAIIVNGILVNKGIKNGPFFKVEEVSNDIIYQQYYSFLIQAKTAGRLAEPERIRSMIEFLDRERILLKRETQFLEKRKYSAEPLQVWLWDILKV
jgi:predicted nucleotidyltransferase